MTYTRRISSKGGITIPQRLRHEAGLMPGMVVDLTLTLSGPHSISRGITINQAYGHLPPLRQHGGRPRSQEASPPAASACGRCWRRWMRWRATMDNVTQRVNEYAVLTQQMARLKSRAEELKAYFERLAVADLKDTKLKTVEYLGSDGGRVTVSMTEAPKLGSSHMLRGLLGDVADDYIKTETVSKPTDDLKRLIVMACQGSYIEGSLDQTIRAITDDEQVASVLHKRLKGQYKRDMATLINVAGLDTQRASEEAYLTAEIINYEWMTQVLRSAGWTGSVQQAVDIIKSAARVEEGIKVSVETI